MQNCDNHVLQQILNHTQSYYINQLERANKRLADIEEKYCTLVWIARRHVDEGETYPEKYDTMYKKEIEDIQSPEIGDWSHGFNSGMLACARLIGSYLISDKQIKDNMDVDYENSIDEPYVYVKESKETYLEREIETAEEWFPFLDS